ncbi:MAG: S46 family peptidase [Xanthomonadales bacterium]|nr:S46 family peptidase [Xanthomonadales bacterium]
MIKRSKLLPTVLLALCYSFASTTVSADEGMWQPHQLPEIAEQLKAAGLELEPESLTDLTGFPMGAIVSTGGCTASFVSPQGLIATNHHCIYGSIQYNSTEDNNLLKNGFLAKSLDQELQATPGSRIYVTEEIVKVSADIVGDLGVKISGIERFKTIDKNRKALVAECEYDKRYRCRVVSFHGGMEYFLFKQLMLRDIRMVYAPATSIGKYGGDIDNWMWPRHTGDFGFYRAYVGKDGLPADYSEDNVPYKPKHFLKISASGLSAGDYIMVLGYPGRTNRYRTSTEVKNNFTWTYPAAKAYREEYIDIIKANSAEGSDARIKYAGTLAGLANYAKNYGSMITSYNKGSTQQRKDQMEKDLAGWVAELPARSEKYASSLQGLSGLILQSQENKERDLVISYMARTTMMSTALALYKLANESQKPDLERDQGYQQRDLARFEQRMKSINRRYDSDIDKAVLLHFIKHYTTIPQAQKIKSLDKFFALNNEVDNGALQKLLDSMYTNTKLGDEETRLQWMKKSLTEFKQSNDPFIQLAVATYKEREAISDSGDALSGDIQAFRPKYMEALIAYYKSIGKAVYADANSTLRITYGNVKSYSPEDGMLALPFTTLEGVAAKHTGEKPFNAPDKQMDLIKQKHYGKYLSKSLDSVPVNYLGTLDITGGNSGSPTLNARAEFVGLAFDGVYESIIGDWDYDEQLNRSISVDSRYMLWVMEYIDGADNLIKEMEIIR